VAGKRKASEQEAPTADGQEPVLRGWKRVGFFCVKCVVWILELFLE